MCFPKFINHLSQTNYTNCIARLQRQKKVEHPGNHFRFVKMKKAPKPYGFSAFCWSECNCRISENADISTVCWQSARGIYSKNLK